MPGPNEDAIVVRFRPIAAASLVASAVKAHRRDGHYRLSVFATSPLPDETVDEVIARLLISSELSHINPDSNPTFFVCTEAKLLLAEGFNFVKDGYDGEVEDHFSVDFAEEPTLELAETFASMFGPRKR